jgi:hypothetical protein
MQPATGGRPHRFTANGLFEFPFGEGKPFLNSGGVLAALASGWQVGGTYEYQPGGLLNWGNLFFYGSLDDIASNDPTLDRWFNVDAGFEKDPARVPANFQKRVFPFRIAGVTGPDLKQLNMNFQRSFRLQGSRTVTVRMDFINLTNRTTFSNPNVTPTSTNFGKITTATSSTPRFVQAVAKFSF